MTVPLRPGYREHRFFDLRDGIIPDLIELEMREVGHLVGSHDAIDDRRAVNFERRLERSMQFARLCRLKALTTASAGKRYKIRIGEFDARPISRAGLRSRLPE